MPSGQTEQRQARYRRGHKSEWLAAGWLMLKGYRVLARRFRGPAGEVDLIVCRRRRLAFVEVKHRPSWQACEASITNRQRQRIRRAADNWLAKNRAYQNHDITFDAVFLVPAKWPRHLPDVL